jgi:membrane-bound inhibitor of C-type lysozyme
MSLTAVLPAWADTDIISRDYACERSVTLPVTFINPSEGPALAVMMYENRLIPMRSAPTGSGARYVSMDEQIGYRLYTKGDSALVAFLAADHTATEEMLLKDCRAAS